MSGFKITSFSEFSTPDQGETIEVTASYSDGTKNRFSMAHEMMPQVVTSFRAAAMMAQKARDARGFQSLDQMVMPYKLRGFRTGAGEDRVLLEMETTAGVPIQVAMTPDQATALSKLLRTTRASKRPMRQ